MRGRGDTGDGAGVVRFDLAAESSRGFLSEALVERLSTILARSVDAGAVVIENRSGTFCLGLDPDLLIAGSGATPATASARAALDRFGGLLRALECAPCPVIVVVDGPAVGGGVALAAAGDLVMATGRATFGLPETLLGIVPALAFPVVARRVGAARTQWMAVSGIAVDATDAERLGLVDVVTDEPEAALARCLRRLARLDRRSIAAVKRLASVYRAEHREFEAAALHTFMQLLDSPETQARLRRFAMGFGPWPDDSSA